MRVVMVADHAVDVVAQRIEQPIATAVCAVLRAEHIPLTAAVAFDGSLHLHPQRPLTTAEEVAALRAFCACTDVRQVWRGERRPITPACLLCDAAGVELVHDLCADCERRFQ